MLMSNSNQIKASLKEVLNIIRKLPTFFASKLMDIPGLAGSLSDMENGTAHFKKCKTLFEYQHLLLLETSGG
jgi:hypothetical protein